MANVGEQVHHANGGPLGAPLLVILAGVIVKNVSRIDSLKLDPHVDVQAEERTNCAIVYGLEESCLGDSQVAVPPDTRISSRDVDRTDGETPLSVGAGDKAANEVRCPVDLNVEIESTLRTTSLAKKLQTACRRESKVLKLKLIESKRPEELLHGLLCLLLKVPVSWRLCMGFIISHTSKYPCQNEAEESQNQRTSHGPHQRYALTPL
ncbi:hypothetical protein BKA70DRAFT_1424079 [Coprinopsis sp. MPI-PUGE-AT-0042]|nr:hypothetical protein BKA70DRAFT_1424079 [Coprinopsis sp. MPI-PUGE-AT-0042]